MRVKLSSKYQSEREEICNRLVDILELDENRSFLLHELDNDIDKQNKILDMKEEIQKHFAVSTISSFKPNFPCVRPYLNIVRGILRQCGYHIETTEFHIKYGTGLVRKTMKYQIHRE